MQPILESYGDLDCYRSMATGCLIRAENEERQRFQAGDCIAVVPGLQRDVVHCLTQDRDLASRVFWSDAESHSRRTQRTSCPRAGTSPKDRVLYRTCPTFRQHESAEKLIPLHKTCAFSTTAISITWESWTIKRMRYLCVGCRLRDQASNMVRLAMPLAVNGQRRRSCSL
jgi:hypothetical protein